MRSSSGSRLANFPCLSRFLLLLPHLSVPYPASLLTFGSFSSVSLYPLTFDIDVGGGVDRVAGVHGCASWPGYEEARQEGIRQRSVHHDWWCCSWCGCHYLLWYAGSRFGHDWFLGLMNVFFFLTIIGLDGGDISFRVPSLGKSARNQNPLMCPGVGRPIDCWRERERERDY